MSAKEKVESDDEVTVKSEKIEDSKNIEQQSDDVAVIKDIENQSQETNIEKNESAEIQPFESDEDIKELVETATKLKQLKASNGQPKPRPKWKKYVFWLVFIGASIGALAITMVNDFVGSRDDVRQSLEAVRWILHRNWWWLVLAVLAAFCWFLLRTLSYSVKMRIFSGRPRYKVCFSVMMIGSFYDKVTPMGLGAKPFQMMYLEKNNVPEGATIAIPITSYAINRLVFVLMGIAALIVQARDVFNNPYLSVSTGIIIMASIGIVLNVGVPLLLIVSLFSKRASDGLAKFFVRVAKFLRLTKNPERLQEKILIKLDASRKAMKLLAQRKRLLLCFVITVGAVLASASVGYFVLKAFGFGTLHGLGWIEIVSLNILITCSITFIPTPGNAGAAELSFYWVFYGALISSTQIASGAFAMLVWRLIGFYMIFLISAVYVAALFGRENRLRIAENRNSLEEEEVYEQQEQNT